MNEFLSDEYFDKFRTLIYQNSGIHFSSSNRSILSSRLKERIKNLQISSIEKYYEFLLKDPEELKLLLDAVTTNLTKFFRNLLQFETLQYFVIPELLQYKRNINNTTFRIWSAGCSTGEEPYTIAMLLSELIPSNYKIEITASDLSLKSLMYAKEGSYSINRMNGVPEDYIKKFFSKRSDSYVVNDSIKKLISFDYHNLKYDSGKMDFDIVFCRNVLIYFDENAQREVVNRFWTSMSNYSYLFIGHSESLFGMNTKFKFVKTDWACIYSKILT